MRFFSFGYVFFPLFFHTSCLLLLLLCRHYGVLQFSTLFDFTLSFSRDYVQNSKHDVVDLKSMFVFFCSHNIHLILLLFFTFDLTFFCFCVLYLSSFFVVFGFAHISIIPSLPFYEFNSSRNTLF